LIADGHTLFDDALHTTHANAQFVLDQFTDGLDAAITEVVDIILVFGLIVDHDHAAHQIDDIPFGHTAIRNGDAVHQVKFLIEFVTPDAFQVIMTHIEDLLFEELLGVFEVGRVTRAHTSEEFDERGFRNRLPM